MSEEMSKENFLQTKPNGETRREGRKTRNGYSTEYVNRRKKDEKEMKILTTKK